VPNPMMCAHPNLPSFHAVHATKTTIARAIMTATKSTLFATKLPLHLSLHRALGNPGNCPVAQHLSAARGSPTTKVAPDRVERYWT
jgi:hypothetical protein